MKKIISTRDVAAIKKMAQIVNPLVSKKATILKKIASLTEEIEGPEGLNVQIAGMEAGIKAKFLGLGTEQLVKKVVSPSVRPDGTPVLDAKTGKQLTKTTWELLPCITYNEDKKNYTLTIENNSSESADLPMTEMGNDFDADTERFEAEVKAQDAFAQENSNNPFNF